MIRTGKRRGVHLESRVGPTRGRTFVPVARLVDSARRDAAGFFFFPFGDGGSSRVPRLRLERRSAFSFPDVPAAPQTRVDDSINNLSIP